MTKFSEDEWIETEVLYQLWMAEGMIVSSEKREGETMMQVAESYLGELVQEYASCYISRCGIIIEKVRMLFYS